MKINNYPLLKVLFPFVLGILVRYFVKFPVIGVQKCGLLMCVILPFLLLTSLVRSYKWQFVKTFVMGLSYVLLGVAVTDFHLGAVPDDFSSKVTSEKECWLVRVTDFPSERERSVKLVISPLEKDVRKQFNLRKMLLYVEKNEASKSLAYGDVLMVSFHPTEIAPPDNPYAFDNQQYMRRRGICYSGYVRGDAWKKCDNRPPNPLKRFSKQLQEVLANTLSTAGMTGAENEILRAILLGDDDTMEPELKAAYASAGVSHILCVSGMHVGIIFMIINTLLKPLDLFKSTRVVKAAVLMLAVWLYACITGLSPSVTRSATMFTFVTFGGLLRRNTDVFHSLLASMFLLLVSNPMLLFEVGFQLSYLAVVGIVLWQPLIAKLYSCRFKVTDYFWGLLTVSVAAQLTTFPISVYYFGQFPNYFMLSNLSVISLSFLVMVSGVLLLAIAFVPLLAKWMVFVLTHEIRLMNGIIAFIEHLPGAVTRGIDYRFYQVLLLYLVIFLLYVAIRYRRRQVGWTAALLFTAFSLSFVERKMQLVKQQDVTVYNVRKACAVGFCCQQQGVLMSDSITDANDKLYAYSIQNHARRQHATWKFVPLDTMTYDTPWLCKRGNCIRFGNKSYYVLSGKKTVYEGDDRVQVDCLLLQHNPAQDPDRVGDALSFKSVVADASCSTRCISRWQTWCEQHHIPFEHPRRS